MLILHNTTDLDNTEHSMLHTLFMPLLPLPTVHSTAQLHQHQLISILTQTKHPRSYIVPVGWEIWGKLVVYDDGFDGKAWGKE